MQSLALVTRVHVLAAIRDHDLQGPTEFREALGFEELGAEFVVERGRRYDARALLAYAHGKATGTYLGPDDLPVGALQVLSELGFRVATLADLERPKPAGAARAPRTPRATATRATSSRSKPEPVIRLCPTCHTQLSVTGICDFCD